MMNTYGYPLITPMGGQNHYTIMGVDPGTTNLGVAVLHVEFGTNRVVGASWKALNANKPTGGRLFDSWGVELYGERATRLRELAWMFGGELVRERPTMIACETSFFNQANASAYGPLMETIKTVENSVHAWNACRPLYRIETSVAKQSISPVTPELKQEYKALSKSKALPDSKAKVLWCAQRHPEFSQIMAGLPYNEHGLDALVIAYAQLVRVRNNNFEITF